MKKGYKRLIKDLIEELNVLRDDHPEYQIDILIESGFPFIDIINDELVLNVRKLKASGYHYEDVIFSLNMCIEYFIATTNKTPKKYKLINATKILKSMPQQRTITIDDVDEMLENYYEDFVTITNKLRLYILNTQPDLLSAYNDFQVAQATLISEFIEEKYPFVSVYITLDNFVSVTFNIFTISPQELRELHVGYVECMEGYFKVMKKNSKTIKKSIRRRNEA